MKVVTFLGTSDYQRATYHWDEKVATTGFFCEALWQWLQPKTMHVLLTEEAAAHANWQELQRRIDVPDALISVSIPSGRSEAELWTIFDALTKVVDDGDEVVVDITHAFRSLPVVGLMATQFLRAAGGMTLRGLLYGAYEARDNEGNVPVFDLTRFLTLLDWMSAAERFRGSGDARPLAGLLRQTPEAGPQSSAGNAVKPPAEVSQVAGSLEDLSEALAVTQPHRASRAACRLDELLADDDDMLRSWARPFGVLLEQVQESYRFLAAGDLAAQRQLVHWYLERERPIEALTLGREWLVSWACEQLGVDPLKRAGRAEVEAAINQHARAARVPTEENKRSVRYAAVAALPQYNLLMDAWQDLAARRNDVAHCGMSESVARPRKILRKAGQLLARLDELPV